MKERKKRKARTSPRVSNNIPVKTVKKQKKQSAVMSSTDDELDENRDRTPSGSVLTGVVKDMRYFFSPRGMNTRKRSDSAERNSQSVKSTVKA